MLTRKWREVGGLLQANAPVEAVASAAAMAQKMRWAPSRVTHNF